MAEECMSIFDIPESYVEPEEAPTYAHYERKKDFDGEPRDLTLQLVGKNPLWGHLLWNAGRVTADLIDSERDSIRGKTVCELGAAAALPSLLASLVAKNVVTTDYPDPDLIQNIDNNIKCLEAQVHRKLPITAMGFIWGHDPSELLNAPGQNGEKFDYLILSDLVFNHSEHRQLLKSCKELLKSDGTVWVVFTPHRPHKFENDMNFFELAKEYGFIAEKLGEKKMSPMFDEDDGCRVLRSTVFTYKLHF